jgi:hypothetical protein
MPKSTSLSMTRATCSLVLRAMADASRDALQAIDPPLELAIALR